MFATPHKPAGFPCQAAFASAHSGAAIGGAGFATGYKPHKRAGWKGKSLRAALAASGCDARRIAAKLAVASEALAAGQPIDWPRGY